MDEWSGGAKGSCTSRHRGVQLILAYSWVRPAILVVGKGRRGMFLFLLFLHFHSCSSFFPVLSFISSATSSISFLPFSGRRHKMTHKGWRVVKPQHNQLDFGDLDLIFQSIFGDNSGILFLSSSWKHTLCVLIRNALMRLLKWVSTTFFKKLEKISPG